MIDEYYRTSLRFPRGRTAFDLPWRARRSIGTSDKVLL